MEAVRLGPDILDALSFMKPGEISRVVETSLGFHILELHPQPPERLLSAQRIMVAYTEVLRPPGREGLPHRSRADALALANQYVAEVRANPAAFDQLARTRSEHFDAEYGGFTGVVSTYRPVRRQEEMANVLEVLGRLEVGEISDPVDSDLGFQILRRLPVPAEASEDESLVISEAFFIGTASPSQTAEVARAAARTDAAKLIEELATRPEAFDEHREQRCCRGADRWWRSETPPQAWALMQQLEVGEVAREAFEDEMGVHVVKRLDESALRPRSVRFTLPAPDYPNVGLFFEGASPQLLNSLARQIGEAAVRRASGDEDAARVLLETIDSALLEAAAASRMERRVIFRDAMETIRQQLGEEQFGEFYAEVEHGVRSHVMAPASERSR